MKKKTSEMTIAELRARAAEIRTEVNAEGADLDALEAEADEISQRIAQYETEQRRLGIAAKVADGAGAPQDNPTASTDAQTRAQQFKENRRAVLGVEETRAVLVSGGKLATPTEVNTEIQDRVGVGVSSIIDMVWVDDCAGMSTDRIPYVKQDADAAADQTEGAAATTKEATYDYIDITPKSEAVLSQISKTWEWGWYVCVQLDAGQTPDTVNFLYFCHCAKLLVSVGQKISSGDALGIMGNTGNAAGGYEHCHFEVRATATGTGVDPTAYAGISNAVGVYGTAGDGQTEQISETPTGKTMQCLMIGPLDSAAAAKCDALADRLALASVGRYATLPGADAGKVKCVGAVSNGDAVSFYQLAEAEGWTKDNKYLARYVG